MRRCSFPALFLCSAALLFSQTTPNPAANPHVTIQSNVRVVLLDVLVTDKDGKPATGLTQDDFRILEDGKQQKIASFKEHNGATVSVAEPPKLPKDVYTNYTELQNADSINVILMDALNTQVQDQSFVHQQVIKYLKTIPAGARVAIFTLSSRLRMVQGFTTDSSQLLAVLNEPKLGTPRQSALLPTTHEQQADEDIIKTIEEYSPSGFIRELLAEQTLTLTQNRVWMTLGAFQEIAHYLSAFPGRKNVIWVSGAFPISIFPDETLPNPSRSQITFTDEIKKTTNLCAAAQMAIYPVATQGLTSYASYQANGAQLSQDRGSIQTQKMVGSLDKENTGLFGQRATIETVAKETGGQAFHDTNDLKEVLARVTDLGMHYYSLSYSPTNTKIDGRFRSTHVEVTNGKYKLAYRQGYYATDPKSDSASSGSQDPLLPLLGMGLPDLSQIVYTLRVSPAETQAQKPVGVSSPAKGPTIVCALDFGISLYHMKLDALPDGRKRVQLKLRAVAYDDAGKPISLSEDQADLALPPAVFAEVQQTGIHIPLEIKLPANASVHLRTGVYDVDSGNAGTLGIVLKTGEAKAVPGR